MSAPKPIESHCATTALTDADGAVGVPERHWFVAVVNHNSEIRSAEKLRASGFTSYVATQKELRIWRNGRRKTVDRVVISSLVFIHCTETERRAAVNLPFIFRFLTDKASASTPSGRPVAIIPQKQMETLQFMLGHSDTPVEITSRVYGKGDKVRVIRGNLRGVEGIVVTDSDGQSELIVNLDILGNARCRISPVDLEPIP